MVDTNLHYITFEAPIFQNQDEETKENQPYLTNLDYSCYITKYTEEVPKRVYTEHAIPRRNGILLENLRRTEPIKITVEFYGSDWGYREYINALLTCDGFFPLYDLSLYGDKWRYAYVSNITEGDNYPVAQVRTFTVEFTAQPQLYLPDSDTWGSILWAKNDETYNYMACIYPSQSPYPFYPKLAILFQSNTTYSSGTDTEDLITLKDDKSTHTISIKKPVKAKGLEINCLTAETHLITDWTETKDESGHLTDIQWTTGDISMSAINTSQYPFSLTYYEGNEKNGEAIALWSQRDSGIAHVMLLPRWYTYL